MDTTSAGTTSQSGKLIEIDVADPTFKKLCEFATRIDILLNSPKATSNNALVGALDDLLGAIYSLIFAKVNDFQNRPNQQIDRGVVIKRAEQLAQGKVRNEDKWMAGFHFNGAIYRLSATYHRFLKIVSGKDERISVLGPEVEVIYRQWTGNDWENGNIRQVHIQVNDLKHVPEGIYELRRATLENGVSAVGELLDLVEQWK
jgi:hypothetical protein